MKRSAKLDVDLEEMESEPEIKKNVKEMKEKKNEKGQTVVEVVDECVFKTILEESKGDQRAMVLGSCWITIVGTAADGTEFLSAPFEEVSFLLGRGFFAKGLEMSVATMLVGEKALVVIKDPEYGYSEQHMPETLPKENVFPLTFEVALHYCEKEYNAFKGDDLNKRYECCQGKRKRGNDLFKLKKYETALQFYCAAQDLANFSDKESPADLEKEFQEQRVNCLINIAAVELIRKNYKAVTDRCTTALTLDTANIKALFRRAKANRLLSNFKEAKQDLELAILHADKNSKPPLEFELQLVKQGNARIKAKEKKMFGGKLKDIELYGDKAVPGYQKGLFGFFTYPIRLCFQKAYEACCAKKKMQ